MAKSITAKFLTASLFTAVAAGGTYGLMIRQKLKPIDPKTIPTSRGPPLVLCESKSYGIINPRRHTPVGDSRYITLQIPSHLKDASDEVLLSKFVRGYFGGLVIGPERLILGTLRFKFTQFTSLSPSTPDQELWKRKELPEDTLPPLGSLLFGTFKVLDKSLHQSSPENHPDSPTKSYIDFAYGRDDAFFSGFHRFSVVRSSSPKEEKNETPGHHHQAETVQIHCESVSCNPMRNGPFGWDLMMSFHMIYASLLFREGIVDVINEKS